MSYRDIQAILKKDLGWKPYKPHHVQQLFPDNFNERMEFCEYFLQWTDDYPGALHHIIRSEAVFHVGGFVKQAQLPLLVRK